MKKLLISALAIYCAFLNVSGVSAMNTPGMSIEPYAMSIPCPECGGVCIVTTTRTYEHDESFPCTHYANGRDYYKVYEVTEKEACRTCGYSYTYKYEDHVFDRCGGRK